LGINFEEKNTGRNSGLYSIHRKWEPYEKARLEAMIDSTYDQFKTRVGEGRNLSAEEVENVARGRVWSGQDAKDNGLVDELGGLYDAIAYAREEADLPKSAQVNVWSIGESDTFSVASYQLESFLNPLGKLQSDWQTIQTFQSEQYWLVEPNTFIVK
jgi:ClpP class serine protease